MGRHIDIAGERYGRLVAVEPAKSAGGRMRWRCRCDCGRTVVTSGTNLRKGDTRSCGCLQREEASRLHVADMTGVRFSRLVVVGEADPPDGVTNGCKHWLCLCDCGRTCVVSGSSLRQIQTRSCGCYKREKATKDPGEASFNRLYARYDSNARTRCLTFNLTRDEFRSIVSMPCRYCGIPPSQVACRSDRTHFVHNGLDRIDNAKGYEMGNVAACCKACNNAKGTMTEQNFLAWAARLARHQKF